MIWCLDMGREFFIEEVVKRGKRKYMIRIWGVYSRGEEMCWER